jgi:predicted dehydrogenase
LTNIAVLGTGSIGLRHLRIFSSLPGVDVFAVPVRPERINELKSEGYKTAGRYEDLPKLDGVVVATNTISHLLDAEKALNYGAHVLIEKPIAPSATGVRSLLELAGTQKKEVFVGCCLRFSPSMLTFRQRLPEIGPSYAVEITCRSYLPDWRPERDYRTGYAADAHEGGVLRDLIHEIDYGLWLFGTPHRVFGHLDNSARLGIPTEDQATLLWKSVKGTQVCIQLDYLARFPLRFMTAFCEFGQISVDLIKNQVTLQRPGLSNETIKIESHTDEMYLGQARAFLSAIQGEDSGQLASGTEGLIALSVCESCTGEEVIL